MRSHLSHTVVSRLMLGTALATLSASAVFAQAQETVTVTGTSIRGQAPVGANVISVDRAAIEATGAQTTQQLLSTIPQLSDFGSSAQGNLNTGGRNNSGPDGGGNETPTIHSLGSSTSTSTLILIDGHRLPNTGLTHNLTDASIIPPNAIQNVEVLPDGASAIYGSDAVAGVINFHTRKDYNGWETTVQGIYADHYNGANVAQVFGHSWDGGGVVAAYSYSSRSNLMNINRDFITARQDLRLGATNPANFCVTSSPPPAGTNTCTAYLTGNPTTDGYPTVATTGQPYPSMGGNFQNFTSCPTAVIATSSSAAAPGFLYPYSTTNFVQRQATGFGGSTGGPGVGICDTVALGSSIPSELRNQGLVSIHQALTDRLQASVDLIYSSRLGTARAARGGVSNVLTWNPSTSTGGPSFGSNQSNPFFVAVPGTTGTSRNSEFVSMGLDGLLQGLGNNNLASTKTGQITSMATAGLDFDLGSDWLASLGGTVGQDYSFSRSQGGVNGDEVNLALNGTTSATGAAVTNPASSVIIDPYGLGTVVNMTRALTTANALDVWNPAGPNNRTSPAVLRSIVDSAQSQDSIQGLQNATLHFDGPLFDLTGAGKLKAAFGAEWIHNTWNQRLTRTGNGPQSTGAAYRALNYQRNVWAVYAEFVLPLISADMEIPLIRNFTMDFAGRWDHYDSFGDAKNPKISFNWDIVDGIRTSGSLGASFTAPPLGAIGQAGTGISAETNVGNGGAQNGLVVLFNDTRGFNGGAGIAGTFVSNAVACGAAKSTPVDDAAGLVSSASAGGLFPTAIGCKINSSTTASPGLTLSGANASLKPQIGQTYSANILIDFGKLTDGFTDIFDGLTTQVTYYQAKINGLITNVNIQTSQTNAGIPSLTFFGPANGCNAATLATCAVGLANAPGWSVTDPIITNLVVGRPLGNPLPPRVYSLGSSQVQNALNLWQNGLDFAVNYHLRTDSFGDFTFGLSGNQILRFTQQNAGAGAIPFNILDGRNGGRFVGQEFAGSLSVNWHLDPITLGVHFNHQSAWNDGVTTFPFNLPGLADPSVTCNVAGTITIGAQRCANTEHIGAFDTVSLNASYDLPDDMFGGLSSGTQLSVNVNDLFNKFGPYEDNSSGLATGSAIGRQVTVAIRKKW